MKLIIRSHHAVCALLAAVIPICHSAETTNSSPPATNITIGDPARSAELPTAILNAYTNGARDITIASGTYKIPPTGRGAIRLDNWTNAVIHARGVTIIFEELNQRPVHLHHCDRVTIEGATLLFAEPSFTQGRVKAIGEDAGGKYLDWQIDAGYPVFDPAKSCFDVVDQNTRLLKTGTGDTGCKSAESIGTGIFRLRQMHGKLGPTAVNDWLFTRRPGGGSSIIHISDSSHCTMRDITLQNSGFAAFFETGGEGGHCYVGCHVTPGPKPAGATEEQLVGCGADGFHSAGTRTGPTIERCTWEGVLHDDCIAIHGSLQKVVRAGGSKLILEKGNRGGFETGEPVRISSGHGFYGEFTCTAMRILKDEDHLLELTLDRESGAPEEAKASNPRHNGAGYKIINCTLGNCRSRGILVKADNGLIEDCTISGCGMSAISIGPEYWWGEADYSRNVTVKGNTLRNNVLNGSEAGTIFIHGDGAIGNANITITGNTFDQNYGQITIHAEDTDGLQIADNRFVASPHPLPDKHRTVLDFKSARNILLQRNVVENSSTSDTLVTLGKNVEGITGNDSTGLALTRESGPWSDSMGGHPMPACPENFKVQLLPGIAGFVFTMYGTPGELDKLKQLIQVMRDQSLGNGFDPGPTPQSRNKPLFDYIASAGWPVACYPGGGEMQIKGGRCVLGPENMAALESMDRSNLFTAVQLGEWGYFFHNLSRDENWFRSVYGKDFDQFKHLVKPKEFAGYDRMPAGKQECFDTVKDYFVSRSHDMLDRIISVTGHSHYEAYAGEWGARCIGLEVGENIAFTQSKLAFARGASRQWKKPWSVQVSPWMSGACTTSGPLRKEGNDWRGLDAGHSLSFYERMWLHAWFAGAAMVTPENSIAIFFEKAAAPWTLTEHGTKASEVFRFMQSHDRGVPHTPVTIVIDHLAGYNGYMDKPWGILKPTEGDRQLRDLFDTQLFPGSDHIHQKPDPNNPEASYLRPTPYGEIFDVQLTSASAEMLASYQVILLAGDISFDDTLVAKLENALKRGSTLLLSSAHRQALGERFARLATHPGIENLEPWKNPATDRSTAISDVRLRRLADDVLPVTVSGDPIQYQVNRTANGWVIELVNNAGVVKKPGEPQVVDPNAIARVVLKPKIQCASAREWRSGSTYPNPEEIRVEAGPGQTAFVELIHSAGTP